MAMQDVYDYKKFAILYVDDEEKSLKLFKAAFKDTFTILTASSAQQALSILEEQKDHIGILMTDQRMPRETGVWLLERARRLQPRLVRILVTAYSDMEAAIAAVNAGAIYKYVGKPWDPAQLEQTLKHGLEFFMVQRERDELLAERMSVLHNMMIADRVLSLGFLAAGLGHHIRNALVAVKTFLDLAPTMMQAEKGAGEGLRNAEFWKEYYDNVQGQIHKINRLLNDLVKAVEKPASQFPDRIQLHQVIAAVLAKMKETLATKSICVDNQVPPSLPALAVDGSTFPRIFELLLQDEIVSLPAGSSIRLSASSMAEREAEGEIEVQVRDNGPGLPQEALEQLFNPFVARSDSPAEYGINLMACYFIVHHHGGRIQARSEPGQGTTFRLHFPIHAKQLPATQEHSDFLRKVLFNEQLWRKLSSE